MADEEKVKLSSLDESFHANLRAILEGPETGESVAAPAPPATEDDEDELLGLFPERYGLVTVEPAQAREAAAAAKGALIAQIGRKLFATRGYHSLIYTMLSRLSHGQREARERERAAAERLNRLIENQAALNEKLGRALFQLWGDYNHLVNVVLDHHLNVVHPNVEERLGRADRLGEDIRGARAETHDEIVKLHELQRKTERELNEKVVELTDLLRDAQRELNEIKEPHDEMQKNVADLVGWASRFEVFSAKVEDLEQRLSRIESGGAERKDG